MSVLCFCHIASNSVEYCYGNQQSQRSPNLKWLLDVVTMLKWRASGVCVYAYCNVYKALVLFVMAYIKHVHAKE